MTNIKSKRPKFNLIVYLFAMIVSVTLTFFLFTKGTEYFWYAALVPALSMLFVSLYLGQEFIKALRDII